MNAQDVSSFLLLLGAILLLGLMTGLLANWLDEREEHSGRSGPAGRAGGGTGHLHPAG